jgi:hypothetical protein
MGMTLEGKGFFTWKIPRCEHGDPSQIVLQAKAAGLTHLVIKVADGTTVYHGTWGDPTDYTTPVVNALRGAGIKIWGWHYIYGDYPNGEASVAIARIRQYALDGYVIDVEKEFKTPGKRVAAKKFMSQLRAAYPDLTVALSSYRFPSLHPQIPWSDFLSLCNINMPQVYWMKAHNPGDQLERCLEEFQTRSPYLPIIPTGAAFREHGWKPTDGEVLEFCNKAKELNLKAINFWEWSDARSGNVPGVWEAIQNFKWSEEQDAPKDVCVALVDAMNQHDIESIVKLYTLPAVHISSYRSTQGLDNLRSWYSQLFNQILPNGRFKLGNYSGKGNARHFTWTASSDKGLVQNGNDTLGISHGKINYHYSFFTVSK